VHTVSTQLGFHCLVGERLNPLGFAVPCLLCLLWLEHSRVCFQEPAASFFSRSRTRDKLAGTNRPYGTHINVNHSAESATPNELFRPTFAQMYGEVSLHCT